MMEVKSSMLIGQLHQTMFLNSLLVADGTKYNIFKLRLINFGLSTEFMDVMAGSD